MKAVKLILIALVFVVLAGAVSASLALVSVQGTVRSATTKELVTGKTVEVTLSGGGLAEPVTKSGINLKNGVFTTMLGGAEQLTCGTNYNLAVKIEGATAGTYTQIGTYAFTACGGAITGQDFSKNTRVNNLIILDNEFRPSNNIGSMVNNKLIAADKKHNVIVKSNNQEINPKYISSLFDGKGDTAFRDEKGVYLNSLPIVIDINFQNMQYYFNALAIHFTWGWGVENVKVERYFQGAGPYTPCVDAEGNDNTDSKTWETIYETTAAAPNSERTVVINGWWSGGVCKLKITLGGNLIGTRTTGHDGEIWIGEIAAWQEYNGLKGAYVSVLGDTMYGNLNIGADDYPQTLNVMGNTIITSPATSDVSSLKAYQNYGGQTTTGGLGYYIGPAEYTGVFGEGNEPNFAGYFKGPVVIADSGTTSGTLTVKGNTQLGDAATDTVTTEGSLTVKGSTTLGDATTDTTTISGTTTTRGNLNVEGNTQLGNAATDTTTITGTTTINGRVVIRDCRICLGWADVWQTLPTNEECFPLNNPLTPATKDNYLSGNALPMGGVMNADDRFWLWMECD